MSVLIWVRFETSELTSHDKPTFEKHGVIHHYVPNIPADIQDRLRIIK